MLRAALVKKQLLLNWWVQEHYAFKAKLRQYDYDRVKLTLHKGLWKTILEYASFLEINSWRKVPHQRVQNILFDRLTNTKINDKWGAPTHGRSKLYRGRSWKPKGQLRLYNGKETDLKNDINNSGQ